MKRKKKKLLSEYGGEEHVLSIPMEMLYGQTEEYKEYAPDGSLLPKYDTAPITARSRYREDLFINNHTTVWGSYYDKLTGKWGYKCCLQLVKNSFCVGLKLENINATIPLPNIDKNKNSSSSISSHKRKKSKSDRNDKKKKF